MNKRLMYGMLFVLLIAGGGSFSHITAQSSADATKNGARGTEPVVDQVASRQQQSKVRQARGKRHDDPRGHEFVELPTGVETYPEINHWSSGLPALPVKQSDTIVVGTVTGAQAFLSDDAHYVYSEFQVEVEQVFKNADTSILPGNVITSERPGGAVRFPSGRITRIRIHQQGFPQVGCRYVFFLRGQPETQDYLIVTGYELRTKHVQPLDGVGFSTEQSQFSKYAGTSQESFLLELKNAIDLEGRRP